MSDKKIVFEAIGINGDWGYASDYHTNGLFKVDMRTYECKFVGLFPNEPLQTKRMHCMAVWDDNKVYFIPGSGNSLDVFDIEYNIITSIEIPLSKCKKYSFYRSDYKFIRAVKKDDYLWLVPATYPGVIKFDIHTQEMTVFDEWINDEPYCFRIGMCLRDDFFIIPNGLNNAILIFDMQREKGEIIHVGSENNGAMSMCYSNDKFWIAPRLPGAITVWNPTTHEVWDISNFPQEFLMGKLVFSYVYTWDNRIIFTPSMSNKALCYTQRGIEIDNSVEWKKSISGTLEFLFENEAYRFFREVVEGEDDRGIKISKLDNNISTYAFYTFDESKWAKCIIESKRKKSEAINENKYFGLSDYLAGLA